MLRFMTCTLTAALCACGSGAPTTQAQRATPTGADAPKAQLLSEALVSSLKGAEVILIGETHDHPQHHALQAELIRRISPKAVAFEMLNASQAEVASALFTQPKESWDEALSWTKRGWPDFKLYQPVFEAAQAVGAQLIAAHPDRHTLMPLMIGQALPDVLIQGLKLDSPLPKEARAELEEEIIRAHCGHAPKAMIQPMVSAQRLKDAWMARALLAAPKPVVMIVGRGHTQEERGIPWALELLSRPEAPPQWTVIALRSDDAARDQVEGPIKVIKTKPHREDDPCERFKEQLKKMGKSKRPPPPQDPSSPSAL